MAFAKEKVSRISALQWTGVTLILICASYFLLTTFRTWRADRAYALGYNLNRVGDFQNAYMTLSEAVKLRESEPVFRDELALTNATIASILYEQKDTVNAPQFATTAVALSNDVTTKYPNNILFWKNRFKIFYLIASSNPPERDVYLNEAIVSLERVLIIAPTDAKTTYNLGLLYRDAGQIDKAQLAFEKAVQLKPDYRDAYFALGQTYHTLSATDPTMQQKAVETMQYILNTFNKDDAEAIKSLTDWNVLSATDAATQPINP